MLNIGCGLLNNVRTLFNNLDQKSKIKMNVHSNYRCKRKNSVVEWMIEGGRWHEDCSFN